ncbi:MAG: hypothetical protein Q9M28_07400 [Mariprofundaceae bacterium]|nr:hypothetical protein [Mariprofundaceae bacterium]
MNIFLTSFLYYAVTVNIILVICLFFSHKRVQWHAIEYPLIYLPWLLMYGLAEFSFENPAIGISSYPSYVSFLSITGGFFGAATVSLRIIWPKAEIGAFATSFSASMLMSLLYMKFIALFFIIFLMD